MANNYLFTSESVSEGHPDKMADAISDAVVDAVLAQDKRARIAVETLVKTGVAIVAGELTTTASVEFEALIRKTILEIGYDSLRDGLRRRERRCHQHHRQAVPGHRAGRGPQGREEAGRRRPGPDVRLSPRTRRTC